jgi:hypothetical protein
MGRTGGKDGKGKCYKILVDKQFARQKKRRDDNIKLDIRVVVRLGYGWN